MLLSRDLLPRDNPLGLRSYQEQILFVISQWGYRVDPDRYVKSITSLHIRPSIVITLHRSVHLSRECLYLRHFRTLRTFSGKLNLHIFLFFSILLSLPFVFQLFPPSISSPLNCTTFLKKILPTLVLILDLSFIHRFHRFSLSDLVTGLWGIFT